MNRCMPWPLAVLCWLDNRLNGLHVLCEARFRVACKAHDKVMTAWWLGFPASEYKFNRKHLGAS